MLGGGCGEVGRLDLKFGVHYRGDATKASVVAYAQRLEKVGFDGFWVTEGARSRDPLTLLAAASSATELELGTGVLLLPFRHPVLLARPAWDEIPDEGARALEVTLIPCQDLTDPGDVDVPEGSPPYDGEC